MGRIPTQILPKMTAAGVEGITIPHQTEVTFHLTNEGIGREEGVHLYMTAGLKARQALVLSVDHQFVITHLLGHIHQEGILAQGKCSCIDNL